MQPPYSILKPSSKQGGYKEDLRSLLTASPYSLSLQQRGFKEGSRSLLTASLNPPYSKEDIRSRKEGSRRITDLAARPATVRRRSY